MGATIKPTTYCSHCQPPRVMVWIIDSKWHCDYCYCFVCGQGDIRSDYTDDDFVFNQDMEIDTDGCFRV